MSFTYTFLYSKPGAVFATAEEALADKNSLFGADLTNEIQTAYDTMHNDGILLPGWNLNWDQSTQQLSLNYEVSDVDAFLAASRANLMGHRAIVQSELAGWTYLNNDRINT